MGVQTIESLSRERSDVLSTDEFGDKCVPCGCLRLYSRRLAGALDRRACGWLRLAVLLVEEPLEALRLDDGRDELPARGERLKE